MNILSTGGSVEGNTLHADSIVLCRPSSRISLSILILYASLFNLSHLSYLTIQSKKKTTKKYKNLKYIVCYSRRVNNKVLVV